MNVLINLIIGMIAAFMYVFNDEDTRFRRSQLLVFIVSFIIMAIKVIIQDLSEVIMELQ